MVLNANITFNGETFEKLIRAQILFISVITLQYEPIANSCMFHIPQKQIHKRLKHNSSLKL